MHLIPGSLTLAQLHAFEKSPTPVALDAASRERLDAGAQAVARIIEAGKPAYGINTGFGQLAREHIPAEQLELLQTNLVLSHSVGVGPRLDDGIVRLTMLLKIASLARGYSGVRPQLVDALLALVNAGVYPCIPAKGSVGASGDLAPLAHMTGALLGWGRARHQGREIDAAEGLRIAGLAPLTLAPKEGLALLNGTQVSTALALHGLFAAENVFAAAIVGGALAVDAAKASDTPFDGRIHELRGQLGQIEVAATLRRLLHASAIRASHVTGDDKVQDPYSLRCQPQVMGACLDVMNAAALTLATEANGVTDNPLIFPDTGESLSGGNFHAEPVAFAADQLALAIAEIGALCERRIALLIDATLSGLPPFLTSASGVNSGFMIAHVTAARSPRRTSRSRTRRASIRCRLPRTRRTTSRCPPSPRGASATWRRTRRRSSRSSSSPPRRGSTSAARCAPRPRSKRRTRSSARSPRTSIATATSPWTSRPSRRWCATGRSCVSAPDCGRRTAKRRTPATMRIFRLDGKRAVVTGGARGIGAATVKLLREAGAQVEALDLDNGCDVTDEAQVKAAFARFGDFDVLVNNAGRAARKSALELSVEEWDAVLDVNLRAVFVCSRHAFPGMKRRGAGAIVNLASIMGLSGGLYPNASYQASKGGVVNLTRALALEWAADNVRVNAVAPTFVRTDLTTPIFADADRLRAVMEHTPLGRLPAPDDIAAAILYLASPAAACVTGITLPVDSGFLAR